jgi:DNA-binding MarR family transcriptional regulator
MGVDRSTVVAVIDRLEGRGLVVRDPSPKDRRSYALRLSDVGESLLSDLIPMVEKYDREAANKLSDEEVETLVDLLRRMVGDA